MLGSTTSAPDLCIHVITDSTVELYQGGGTVVPKLTSPTFRPFRNNPRRRSVLGDGQSPIFPPARPANPIR